MLKKVVIVGTGESAWDFILRCWLEGRFWSPGELWGINSAGYSFRCDKVFSLHDSFDHMPEGYLRDLPEVPLVTLKKVEGVNWEEYPLQEVLKRFKTTYFNNSISYMIALAILRGAEDIWLYGTDFNYHGDDEDDERNRHCVRYWIGRAEEAGARIHLPVCSKLAERGFYGFFKGTPQVDADFNLKFEDLEKAVG